MLLQLFLWHEHSQYGKGFHYCYFHFDVLVLILLYQVGHYHWISFINLFSI